MNKWTIVYGETPEDAMLEWERNMYYSNIEILSISHTHNPDGLYSLIIVYKELKESQYAQ